MKRSSWNSATMQALDGLSTHVDEIQTALKNVQPGGLTAMLDAINTGLREMKKAKNPRKGSSTAGIITATTRPPRSSHSFARPMYRSTPWACFNRSCLRAHP